jgi:hypothetical protein
VIDEDNDDDDNNTGIITIIIIIDNRDEKDKIGKVKFVPEYAAFRRVFLVPWHSDCSSLFHLFQYEIIFV